MQMCGKQFFFGVKIQDQKVEREFRGIDLRIP